MTQCIADTSKKVMNYIDCLYATALRLQKPILNEYFSGIDLLACTAFTSVFFQETATLLSLWKPL